jgi:hypothetical protein
VVAATGDRIPAGAAVLDDGTTTVAAWRWPHDPSLPGLAAAVDRARVASLLDDLGIGGGSVQLRVRSYRPGRRAVIEATGRRGRLFLKVVRPASVEALHDMHRSLADHLPVPDSLGWTAEGLLVLHGLRGRTLRDLLRSGRSEVPPPGAIDALLDRLPRELAAGPRRKGLVADADRHAAAIGSALPSLRDQAAQLAADVRARPLATQPLVPVHGDLYESQLLIDRGRVTGLLDIDTAGAGHRADDLANLCAHLSVLALVADHTKVIKRYGSELLAHAEGRFDPVDVRTRIAAAVIGLATGPFRVLERNVVASTARRLELARQWLDGTAST